MGLAKWAPGWIWSLKRSWKRTLSHLVLTIINTIEPYVDKAPLSILLNQISYYSTTSSSLHASRIPKKTTFKSSHLQSCRYALLRALTTLVTAFAFANEGSAFVITTYTGRYCQGETQHVNVWDHTCATWMHGFNSYRAEKYGGKRQRSYFFIPGNCGNIADTEQGAWVDGLVI